MLFKWINWSVTEGRKWAGLKMVYYVIVLLVVGGWHLRMCTDKEVTLCVKAPSLQGGKGKKPRRQKIQGCQHRDYRRSSLWLSPTNRPSQWLLGRKPKKNQSCLQKEWEWVSIKNPKRYWFRKLMETHQAKLCTSRKEQHPGGPKCHQHQHTACVQGPRKGSLYRSSSPTHFSFWRDKECEACDGFWLFLI